MENPLQEPGFEGSGAAPVSSAADLDEPAVGVKEELQASENGEEQPKEESEEDEYDQIAVQQSRGPAVRKGSECPYLDTISRQVSILSKLIEQM